MMKGVDSLIIRKASLEDLEALCDFYQQVCEDQKTDQYSPDWHWGVYPSKEILENFLKKAQIIIAIEGSKVVSAGVLTDGEDPNYAHVAWKNKLDDKKITVLHLFAVSQKERGQGIAGKILTEFDNFAGDADYSAIHLDVMKGNIPAEKLYQKHGFEFAEEATIHYEDDGDTQAMMYEKVL